MSRPAGALQGARPAKTILVIDDETDLLILFREILMRSGYEVITALDGESALALIRKRAPVDLVITDLRLPGIDGIELVSTIKRELPSVPVIMLTAYGTVESYLKSRSNGVFEYVNKPVQAKELRQIVKAALDWSSSASGLMPMTAV